MKRKPRLTTPELMEKLAYKYGGEAWAFFEQVRRGTGFSGINRTVDAIAMSLWPSRGLDLIGFEVKSFRGDWLRELKDPSKADKISSFCDYWYIVAAKEVVADYELPSTWGLMVPYREGLKITVKAPRREAQPVDRLFLASLMRQAKAYVIPEERLKAKEQEAWKEGHAKGMMAGKADERFADGQLARLRAAAVKFKMLTGREFETWNIEPIAEAVTGLADHNRRRVTISGLTEHVAAQAKALEADRELLKVLKRSKSSRST